MARSRRTEAGERTAVQLGTKLQWWVAASFGLLCVFQAALNIPLHLEAYRSKALDMLVQFQSLTMETEDLETKLSATEKKKLENEAAIKTLTEERDGLERMLADFKSLSADEEWISLHGSLYYVSTSRAPWLDAYRFCQRNDADLISINSIEEQNFTTTLKDDMWIGATTANAPLTWTDGTRVELTFWAPKEPNPSLHSRTCAKVGNHSSLNNWETERCTVANYWICEKKLFLI